MWYISSGNDLLLANMTYYPSDHGWFSIHNYTTGKSNAMFSQCSFKGAPHPPIVTMYPP